MRWRTRKPHYMAKISYEPSQQESTMHTCQRAPGSPSQLVRTYEDLRRISVHTLHAQCKEQWILPCTDAKSNRRIIGLAMAVCKKADILSGISGRTRFSATDTVQSFCPGRYRLSPVRLLTSSPSFSSPGPTILSVGFSTVF